MGEGIEWVLAERGLSAKEAKLYLHLAKNGPQKAIEISKNLKIHKVEVYRYLRNLENKGLAESTLERPQRFVATPFAQVLDSLIAERKKTSTALENRKRGLLKQWNSMQTEELPETTDRFAAISGRENVYLKINHLLQQTRREVVAITAGFGILKADRSGFLSQTIAELARISRNTDVHARLLTRLTRENFELIRNLRSSLLGRGLPVDIRYLTPDVKFAPRLFIRDEEEAVVFLTPSGIPIDDREQTGLWTNSKAVVGALQTLFEKLWDNSKALPESIKELENEHV